MNSLTQQTLIQQLLSHTPAEVQFHESSGVLSIDLSSFSERYTWKTRPFELSFFKNLFSRLQESGLKITPHALEYDTKTFSAFPQLLCQLELFLEQLSLDNLRDEALWADTQGIHPTGFDPTTPSSSQKLLDLLHADRFIVKEKKPLVVDFDRSYSSYLVSTDPEPVSIIDAAAQIASLAIGFNHPLRKTMDLRPEVFDSELSLKDWDITQAFGFLLRKQSGLPYHYFVNSGAEAIETCLRGCQIHYPHRKKIIAFDGSFHGRTVLSLHTTHSPTKRLPFQMYPGLVEFLPFPEILSPDNMPAEPTDWVKTWSEPQNPEFLGKILTWITSGDSVLEQECLSLLKVRASLLKERALAVLIEPMQCEGGERYGSPRFFRALRLLTRALDTALIFDEVQTGLGLGGIFFWHKSFSLCKPDGHADFPDAIALAKKTQVGVCLTRFAQPDLSLEVSAASLYRGYLQAVSVLDFTTEGEVPGQSLAAITKKYLLALQKTLGTFLVQNPRAVGIAFAFDLPDATILDALVERRFQNGLLFYQAGTRTARFRVLIHSTEKEIAQIFTCLYGCFLDLSKKGTIGKIPLLEDFVKNLPESGKAFATGQPGLQKSLPWKKEWLPKNADQYLKITQDQWIDIFQTLARKMPELLRAPCSLDESLMDLKKMPREKLWERYLQDPRYSLTDLLWQSSRLFGYSVEQAGGQAATKLLPIMIELQKLVYEPERRDPPDQLKRDVSHDKTVFFYSKRNEQTLDGMCIAVLLKLYEKFELVRRDPELLNPKAYYSMELSTHPDLQGKGLGFRLKCEQYIEVVRQGATVIRSRNRVPQALPMTRLNRTLSAVVIDEDPKAYDGKSLALYQSIQLHPHCKPLSAVAMEQAGLKEKITLSNFVSTGFVSNLLVIKDTLPPTLRHIYLASGKAEALDKLVKVLRAKKPNASVALSLKGDYFGSTTAAARSLGGGTGGLSYFNWPTFEVPDDREEVFAEQLEAVLEKVPSEKILGLFIEPRREKTGEKKRLSFLQEVVRKCHQKQIAVLFHESASATHAFDANNSALFCASLIPEIDGFYFSMSPQLGVVAVNNDLFYDKPLQMISTWDGDEHGLNLLRQRLMSEAFYPVIEKSNKRTLKECTI